MPPHPKRKHSQGRRNRRRSQDGLTPRALRDCSNCGAKHAAHTVCLNCGHYLGKEIIVMKKEEKG